MNQSVNELCIRCAFFDVKEGCALDRHWKRGKDGKITCHDFMPPEAITLPASDSRYTVVHGIVDVWMGQGSEKSSE
ncbi:MAG: hypothetical protein IKO95_02260 [Spirochaetia bacterium]|nr:hypothetical protein [Spirochaetia bacterium]